MINTMFALVKRHFKCFFKTQTNFFFALMVPIVSILIYLVFLRTLEYKAVDGAILEAMGKGEVISSELTRVAHGLVDSWMLSGILALSIITVSLNTCYVVLKDREHGVVKDFASAPIKNSTLICSYVIFNFLVTFVVCFLVLIIEIIILACFGVFFITSFGMFMMIILAMLASTAVACLLTFFIINFFSNNDSFNSIIAIFSAGAGFVIGTYMPLNMLGWFEPVAGFLPGTYSVGIFRKIFLTGQYDQVMTLANEKVRQAIETNFSWNIKFCNSIQVTPDMMWVALGVFFVIFLIINLIFTNHNMQVRLLGKPKKIKKVNAKNS